MDLDREESLNRIGRVSLTRVCARCKRSSLVTKCFFEWWGQVGHLSHATLALSQTVAPPACYESPASSNAVERC